MAIAAMTMMERIGICVSSLAEHCSALNDPNQDRSDGYEQQNVDESTQSVGSNYPQEP